MSRSVALLLVLVFLTATTTIAAKPASSAEIQENTWATKAPLPEGIGIVKAAVANGKIYAMTGESNYEYDPATDNWTAKTPMPTPRHLNTFGIAAYQDKIYVIGGDDGTGRANYLSSNEVYDPLTDTWETKEPMPTGMDWVEANVVNGKIYAIGVGHQIKAYTPYFSLNQVYDPATDSWTTKQPTPFAVTRGASAVVDSKIYIMGGLFNSSNPLNAVANQIYNTENDTWSLGASLPTPMWFTAAGATAGMMAPKRIYVMGGGFTEITNVVNVYDPELDTWSSGVPLPTNRSCHAVAVVNDVLYAIGGYSDYYGPEPLTSPQTPGIEWIMTNVVEAYTPFGYGTIPSESEPFPTTLIATASAALVAIIGIALLVYFKKRNH